MSGKPGFPKLIDYQVSRQLSASPCSRLSQSSGFTEARYSPETKYLIVMEKFEMSMQEAIDVPAYAALIKKQAYSLTL